MTPLAKQRKALMAALGSAITAGSAYVFHGGDLASIETAAVGLITAGVAYLFAFWTPNAS